MSANPPEPVAPKLSEPWVTHSAFAYLTTTGRVSGQPHTVELWFHADEDSVWFLSDEQPDWQRNAEANPEVQVRVGPWKWDARAHLEPPTAMSGAGLAARVAMVHKYQEGYADNLERWARDATALCARVIEPPQPSDDVWVER